MAEEVLVATVTVVFDGGGTTPEAIADALIAREGVTTVRISALGTASVYRADVVAAERAGRHADEVAAQLGAVARVLSVTQVAERERSF